MKFLKFILYLLLGLVALVLLLSLFAKKAYHIERTTLIKAPQEMIHKKVSHWSSFPEWSPWQGLDPNMKTTLEGTDGTVGAKYIWNGNKQAGSGSQTLKSITSDQVQIDVQINEPFNSHIPTVIRFAQQSDGVKVTYGCDLKLSAPWNAFAMFTDVDKALGADYEKGLARLKAVCEKEAQAAAQEQPLMPN